MAHAARTPCILALATALAAMPAAAQRPAAAPTPPAPPAPPAAPSVAVDAIRTNWQQMIGNFTQAADELSEADYAYRPVATVRTLGQLVGHVAGAQFAMCAAALGESAPSEDAVEKAAVTKAALVKALKASTDYCARAYQQTDADAAGPAQLFGQSTTRMRALALNAVHDGEHYGNVVTYMRMRGKVPPSSRR